MDIPTSNRLVSLTSWSQFKRWLCGKVANNQPGSIMMPTNAGMLPIPIVSRRPAKNVPRRTSNNRLRSAPSKTTKSLLRKFMPIVGIVIASPSDLQSLLSDVFGQTLTRRCSCVERKRHPRRAEVLVDQQLDLGFSIHHRVHRLARKSGKTFVFYLS